MRPWCEDVIQPLHVAVFIEALSRSRAAPTAKLRSRGSAIVRLAFDRSANPAASVRGPAHSVKRGKTWVLALEEATELLDSIDARRTA